MLGPVGAHRLRHTVACEMVAAQVPLPYTGQVLRHRSLQDGDARAALYRVPTISYPFMPGADKRDWLRRLARLAFAVEADLSLWRVNRAYPADEYVAQAEGMLDPRRQDSAAWRAFLASRSCASSPPSAGRCVRPS